MGIDSIEIVGFIAVRL